MRKFGIIIGVLACMLLFPGVVSAQVHFRAFDPNTGSNVTYLTTTVNDYASHGFYIDPGQALQVDFTADSLADYNGNLGYDWAGSRPNGNNDPYSFDSVYTRVSYSGGAWSGWRNILLYSNQTGIGWPDANGTQFWNSQVWDYPRYGYYPSVVNGTPLKVSIQMKNNGSLRFYLRWFVSTSSFSSYSYTPGIASSFEVGNASNVVIDSNFPVDKTPPETQLTTSVVPNANGWFRSDVRVSLTANDALSGVKRTEYSLDNGQTWITYTTPITFDREGTNVIQYRSVDLANNVEGIQQKVINIDKTPPTINGAATTTPNSFGWYNTDVTVHFTATDTVSGVDTVTNDTTITTEGAAQSVSGTATDKAGNSSSFVVGGINIDKTPPSTTIALGGTTGNNGWYGSDVKVSLSTLDNAGGSGVAKTEYSLDSVNWSTYIDAITVSTEGSTTVYYRSTDKAGNIEDVKQQVRSTDTSGNIENVKQQVIKIDKTPPSISASLQDSYALDNTFAVQYFAIDTVSGVSTVQAALNGIPVSMGTVIPLTKLGTNTFKIVATDNAGNVQTLVKTFEVFLSVDLTIEPAKLNVNANGVITAFVSLPSPYTTPPLANSVNLNGILAVNENLTNPNHLVFKFNRAELRKVVQKGEGVTVTLSGYTGHYYIKGITKVSIN